MTVGLFMGLKNTPPEVAAANNAFGAIDKHDALQIARESLHWSHIVDAARDELVDAGDVVMKEDHAEVVADLNAANQAIKDRDIERAADARRLQELIAEGNRADALSLLRDMFDGADLPSDAAALMCAGFRQEALL